MDNGDGAASAAGEGIGASGEQGESLPPAVSSETAVSRAFDKVFGENFDDDAPSAKPEGEQAGSDREPNGRFKAKDKAGDDKAADADANAANAGKEDDAAAGAVKSPPPGWSPAAKDAFKALPPEVQDAVVKREQEVNAGLAKLQGFKDLDGYADHYKGQNSTIKQALDSYTAVDRAMAKDFVGTLKTLAKHYSVDVVALGHALAGTQPGQGGQPPQAGQGADAKPGIDPALMQRLDKIENHLTTDIRARQSQSEQRVMTEIQTFAADKEFWPNVEVLASKIMAGDPEKYRSMPINKALAVAYDEACWADPDVRAVLIKRQAAEDGKARADQAQAAVDQATRRAGSLHGSPSRTGDAPMKPAKNSEEAVARAFERLGL